MYITICKIDDQCMKQGTQRRCSGTTQRDRVGREVHKESDTTERLNGTKLLYNIVVVFAIH